MFSDLMDIDSELSLTNINIQTCESVECRETLVLNAKQSFLNFLINTL